jgi:hypothetical protein
MRFENELRRLIPEAVYSFPKLTRANAVPYRFVRWRHDRDGRDCLYYAFPASERSAPDHVKRVPVREMRAALRLAVNTGRLTREGFRRACPTAESAGPCGFAVTGRILESLGVATYRGPDGFVITQPGRAARLLEND